MRPATLGDVPEIVRVHLASRAAAYGDWLPAAYMRRDTPASRAEKWRDILTSARDSGATLVWEDAVALRGFVDGCGLPPATEEQPRCGEFHVQALYVDPAAQGVGGGRRLMRAIARHALGCGYGRLSVWCYERNAPSRAFYERVGGELTESGSLVHDGQEFIKVKYFWPDAERMRRI